MTYNTVVISGLYPQVPHFYIKQKQVSLQKIGVCAEHMGFPAGTP